MKKRIPERLHELSETVETKYDLLMSFYIFAMAALIIFSALLALAKFAYSAAVIGTYAYLVASIVSITIIALLVAALMVFLALVGTSYFLKFAFRVNELRKNISA